MKRFVTFFILTVMTYIFAMYMVATSSILDKAAAHIFFALPAFFGFLAIQRYRIMTEKPMAR